MKLIYFPNHFYNFISIVNAKGDTILEFRIDTSTKLILKGICTEYGFYSAKSLQNIGEKVFIFDWEKQK